MRNFLHKIASLKKEISTLQNPFIYLLVVPSYDYENVIIKIITKQKGNQHLITTQKKIYYNQNLTKEFQNIKEKINELRKNNNYIPRNNNIYSVNFKSTLNQLSANLQDRKQTHTTSRKIPTIDHKLTKNVNQ